MENAADTTPLTFQTKLGAIHGQARGSPKGTPILFLHGVFLDCSFWKYQFDRMPTKYYSIAIDMPRHGQSVLSTDTCWNIEDCAAMLLDIIKQLPQKKVHVIGHSWGAITAIRAAHIDPSCFYSATLFNVPVGPPGFLDRVAFQAQLCFTIFPKFYGEQAAKSLYYSSFISKNGGQCVKDMGTRLSLMPPGSINETIRAVILDAKDIEPQLELLRNQIPVLVCFGEKDYALKQMHGTCVTVPGCGHMLPEEAPDDCLGKILETVEISK